MEARLAEKFAGVLENGSDLQRRTAARRPDRISICAAPIFTTRRRTTPRIAPPDLQPHRQRHRADRLLRRRAMTGSPARCCRCSIRPIRRCGAWRRRHRCSAVTSRSPGSTRWLVSPAVNMRTCFEVLETEKAERRPNCEGLYGGPASASARAAAARFGRPVAVRKSPDEAYFRAYVQPILEKRGKDGYACVHCHATHTLFNGTYSTVMNVVDLNDPENSLILRKPTSSAESEGLAGIEDLIPRRRGPLGEELSRVSDHSRAGSRERK